MKIEIILWMSFLLPEMLIETAYMKVRRRMKPALSEQYSKDTLARQDPRRALGGSNKRDGQNFYQPYHDKGDLVFIRNTWGPDVAVKHNFEEGAYYKNAKPEEYRGCNLVCPDLYERSGEVCGWRWQKFVGDNFIQDEFNQTLNRGHYANFTYSNFKSICHLLTANCRDYLVPAKDARPVWRLAHLGRCFEIDSNYQKNVFMSTWPDPQHGQKHFWETRTDELLNNTDILSFETYKPAMLKSFQTLPALFDPNKKT